jgi:hypothetical protein
MRIKTQNSDISDSEIAVPSALNQFVAVIEPSVIVNSA